MRKFYNLSLAALSFMLVGCNVEEGGLTPEGNSMDPERTYTAILEGGDTKTYLDGEMLKWSPDEFIGIFENYGPEPSKFAIDPLYVGRNDGIFNHVQSPSFIEGAPDLGGYNVAFYPYVNEMSCEMNAEDPANPVYTINRLTIPKTQQYRENAGSELGTSFPMMAISHNTILQFRNVQGLIKLNLLGTAGEEQVVRGIELYGNSGEQLCGNFFVDMEMEEYIPHLRPVDYAEQRNHQYKSIYLDCGEGVQLKDYEPVTFTFSINPTEFVEGFLFIVTLEDGSAMELRSTNHQSVKRSHALVMPPLKLPDPLLRTINYGTVDQSESGQNESGLRFERPEAIPAEWWRNVLISYDPWEGRIYIPADENGLVEIPARAFYYCQSLEWIDIPDDVTSIGAEAFDHCTFLDEVDIPNSLTVMGDNAFSFCAIKSIALPNSLTNMPNAAFEACTQLSKVLTKTLVGEEYILEEGLPIRITEIGNRAFGKTALKAFNFNGVERIGEQAFYESQMTNFDIPESVEYIGNGAFSGCANLGIVNVLSSTPAILGQFAFGEPLSSVPNLKIMVPQDAVDTYKTQWAYYAERILGK